MKEGNILKGFKKVTAVFLVTLAALPLLVACSGRRERVKDGSLDTSDATILALNEDVDYTIINGVLHFGRGYTYYTVPGKYGFGPVFMKTECCENRIYDAPIYDKKPNASEYHTECGV